MVPPPLRAEDHTRGVGVGGNEAVVFLAPVTQLERRSANKRILCPDWLSCNLSNTQVCVCVCRKAVGLHIIQTQEAFEHLQMLIVFEKS